MRTTSKYEKSKGSKKYKIMICGSIIFKEKTSHLYKNNLIYNMLFTQDINKLIGSCRDSSYTI
jgi:hypothetical protein